MREPAVLIEHEEYLASPPKTSWFKIDAINKDAENGVLDRE